MEEIRQELVRKLQDLNAFVEENAKALLDVKTKMEAEEVGISKIRAAEERTVTEKLGMLNLLPDWLDNLRASLQEFTEVAKTLQPKPVKEVRTSALGIFPDAAQHQRNLLEYRELKAEKEKHRSNIALLESRAAVKNLADAAATIGQAERVGFQEEAKQECCFLVTNGFPVEAIAEKIEDLLDEKWTKAVSPGKLRKEAERQLALNQVEVDSYVSSRGSSLGIGHVVHRLLATKYPRPPVPPGERLPQLNVMALLLGASDQDLITGLTKVVADAKVAVVQIEDALETCVEAYRQEGPGIPLLEAREPPQEVPEPDPITPTARLVPHALLEELKALQPPPKQKEVETQTGPEVLPELSIAASLGKQALEMLRLKEPLSDWLITAMMIEHLMKISSQVLGWILVNFPATFEQARIFEASVTGQWVPNPDQPKEERGGVKSLVQSKIVCDPHSPVQALCPFRTIFTSVVALSSTEPPPAVSLVNEVYLRQDVLTCFHCITFDEEKILAIAEMLLQSSPHPRAAHIVLQGDSSFPDFPIPNDIAQGMVALWEALETAYLGRLHRVTLTRRTMANIFTRFLTSLKIQFAKFLMREDNLQRTVDEFADRYNEVPRPWDEESKKETMNRLENFNDTVLGQIEARRREADEELRKSSEQPVLAQILIEKLQVAAAVVQLELDRFVDTVAVLQDFASSSLEKIPPDASKSVRFEVPTVLGADVGDGWISSLSEIMRGQEIDGGCLPEEFEAYLSSVTESAKTYIGKLTGGQKNEISKIEKELQPKPQKGKGGKDKGGKGKKGKGPTTEDVPSLADQEVEKLRVKRMTLLKEWRDMIENEAELTLKAVEQEVTRQKNEAEELVQKLKINAFQVMTTAADVQQSSDCQSMHELKEFLEVAVGAEAQLEIPLHFPRKTLYLSYLQHPNAPISTSRPKSFYQELKDLVNVLQRLAPDGRILLSGLVYLLHQSVAAGKHLPPVWQDLDKDKMKRVLQKHLNGSSVVDWRAMIIGLLELPLASQQQLLLAEERLHLGTREVFVTSRLWFDLMSEDLEETTEVKSLIFDTYCPKGAFKATTMEFLTTAAWDKCPVTAFLKACALHQGQVLEESTDSCYEKPQRAAVMLEAAVSACQAITPTPNDEIGPQLQQIWNEVEDAGLDSEQRRARNRAVAAGVHAVADATQAPVDLLKENTSFQGLAAELFGKRNFEELIKEE